MNVIIIEDELPARAKLVSMLQMLNRDINVIAQLGSVKESVDWLNKNHAPELAFVDVQLSDDHSFEIFQKHNVKFPIIFTTAYDKYILKSFEFNAIDYLLKPITEAKLKRSLEKIQKLKQHFLQDNISNLMKQVSAPSRTRIVANKGTEFITINLDDVAYFFTEHKIVFVRDFSGRQMIVDKNLSELEEELNKEKFFRINRKYIVNQKAVDRYKPDHGKIRVFLNPEIKGEVHVSKETAPEFRSWIRL